MFGSTVQGLKNICPTTVQGIWVLSVDGVSSVDGFERNARHNLSVTNLLLFEHQQQQQKTVS